MYTTLVVDDNPKSLDLLKEYIEVFPKLTLLKATTSPIDALNFLDTTSVDLLFLDVEMPNINGIEFMEATKEKFGKKTPRIVLTTGHDNYALKGFDYGVIDYLLKPFSLSRFKISIDRFIDIASKTSETSTQGGCLFVEFGAKKIKVDFKDILYVEGARNYIYINTVKERIIIHRTLTSIQEELPNDIFLRVHKSFIVNLNNIVSIKSHEIDCGYNHRPFTIGVTYREMVYNKIDFFKKLK